MFVLRGIEITRRGGNKFIKVIVQKDHADIYKTIRKKANVPITRELIMNYATGHFGIPLAEITWPHHVEVNDLP